MNVHHYKTSGGKDLIYEYFNSISREERKDGLSVIEKLNQNETNQLMIKQWQGKILEVYFYKHNRIFYVVVEPEDIYLLHACQKQKNKTEKRDSDIIIKRAKNLGILLSKKFI